MMEGEVDAEVAPPVFLYNHSLPGRFSDARSVERKRDFPWENSGIDVRHQQLQSHSWRMRSELSSWNPKMWEWDSVRFSAKPSEESSEVSRLGPQGVAGAAKNVSSERRRNVGGSEKVLLLGQAMDEEREDLTLKLGGGGTTPKEQVPRPNKRVRSRSPGNAASYPVCQVDDCKADLSNAKDYHRRHKVCEHHSKTAKALVCGQMQRFCQQCSRFHPLAEFDEGKRSCRRRLAGHNRRRRKTQSEDASTNILAPGSQDGKNSGSTDIVNLLTFLARLQGKTTSMSAALDRDQLIQIINKFGSLPPQNPSSKIQTQRCFDLNVSQAPQQSSSELPSQGSGNPSFPSTMNLLAVLSTALSSSSFNALASMSRENGDDNGSCRSRRPCQDAIGDNNLHNKVACMRPPSEGSQEDDSNVLSRSLDHPNQIATPSFPLQLFGSSGDDSPPKYGSSFKYQSSESSNPMEDRSPSCSPPIAKRLFPLHSASDKKDECVWIDREDHAAADASTTCGWTSPSLDLFKASVRQLDNQTFQDLPNSGGYSSSSGSPSSSNCDVQDRTDRIVFKLFDKDPSNLPMTLRSEILNWLSHSPSDIESYIRPGCVVLNVYLCMSSIGWHELEEDLLRRVSSLVNGSGSDFWRNLRFLVRTRRQIISHMDGKIRTCKSLMLTAPELTSISPIAVVSGEEATLILRGRNLTFTGTKIYCTCNGGYFSKEVLGSTQPDSAYDDSSSESFVIPKGLPNSYGRYFIEVENGFRGNSFPILIADATICEELRSLELGIEGDGTLVSSSSQDRRPPSKEDVLHFINELGWLFQRKSHPDFSFVDFATSRFKFLFAFSVERDLSVLVRTLLDILVARCHESDSVLNESLELVLELRLLSQAVKRKCRKMVELLLNYSVKKTITEGSRMYLFPPNSSGPGGLTPLHLAASMEDAEDLVDALTNDPQEIGLSSWVSALDDGGQTPFMYASSRNNAYNALVARKLSDKQNSQVSIMIGHGNRCGAAVMAASSCAHCALAESRLLRFNRRTGLLHRPYIQSMLAIAAVCVCVCLFLRGAPFVGSIAPFEWEKVDFGPR